MEPQFGGALVSRLKKAPVRKAPTRKAPVRKQRARGDDELEAGAKIVRKAPARKAPARKTPARKVAVFKQKAKGDDELEAGAKIVRKVTVRKAPLRKAPARKQSAKGDDRLIAGAPKNPALAKLNRDHKTAIKKFKDMLAEHLLANREAYEAQGYTADSVKEKIKEERKAVAEKLKSALLTAEIEVYKSFGRREQ